MASRHYVYLPCGLFIRELPKFTQRVWYGFLAAPYGLFYCRSAVFSCL